MNDEMKQTLWISAVSPEKVFGDTYSPTAIHFPKGGGVLIGKQAVDVGRSLTCRNFKLNLGEISPGSSPENRRQYHTASGNKSAYELTKEYFDAFLGELEKTYPRSEQTNYKHPAKIIIAEPLSFQDAGFNKQWLSNYRENIRRILTRYEQVEFLPEPFAVYQYYRYGLRLSAMQEKQKHFALIVDFGGGTFDVCVIESTKKGDVSQSGKSSKPLSADSAPIGGFFVNHKLAVYLIKRHLDESQKKVADTHLKRYDRVAKGELKLEELREETQVFIKNYERLLDQCERYKLDLVGQLSDSDWELSKEIYQKTIVHIPKNPFEDGEWFSDELYAHNLRDLFVRDVWQAGLKSVVSSVLTRSNECLDGQRITLTLVSGGSSNFIWLSKLLEKDFRDELLGAFPVPISHSYQEVVANGLAIECARRFYNDDSEFVAVTYNPIKLFLDPDDTGIEENKRYRSVGDKIDMSSAKPGVLVPSAQSLKHFFDNELLWKIRLKRPPKHHLDYFFTRPDAEDGDHNDAYNVEENRVHTKESGSFDKNIFISLTVREDGTASPKFIYKSANPDQGVPENSVCGRNFYIDMTSDSQGGVKAQYFVGFDFGTSNSSACLLTQDKIKIQYSRQNEPGWEGLSSALPSLPFPIAICVRHFLGNSDSTSSADFAREAFEACLGFIAFVAASEVSSLGIPVPMKGFQHRSMGPLKELLMLSLEKLGSKAKFSVFFKPLVKGDDLIALNRAIDDFNDHKHHKLANTGADWNSHVQLLVKPISKMMKNFQFGYCASSYPYGFEGDFMGKFIVAHDNSPFVDSFQYASSRAMPSSVALLKQKNGDEAISLTPFIFWGKNELGVANITCYCLDKLHKGDLIIKPSTGMQSKRASEVDENIDAAGKNLFQHGNTVIGPVSIKKQQS